MGGPNEREYVHTDALVEEIRIAQEQAYSLAREQLKKAAERNKKNYDIMVRPMKFTVGTWVLYYSLRRYVGRSPKWQRNYSGPFLVVKIHSAVTVSIQRSQKADAVVVHTDKLKLVLVTPPRSSLLNAADEPLATREIGTIRSLSHPSVTKDLCDHPLRSVRTLQRELAVTRPSPSTWLITVRWKIQAGTDMGYLRLYGARL